MLSGVGLASLGERGVVELGEKSDCRLQSWDEATGRSGSALGVTAYPQRLMATMMGAGQNKPCPVSRDRYAVHSRALPAR